uniref:Uncharacterized protein n=1 Tax=Panagrolaimus sp. JU765 TaxID=591449 RepID=A0AC34R182_9BILA
FFQSPIPKPAVEINNAQSNYTNGELNPDRYQQPPVIDCPNPIIIKEVSLDDKKSKIEKKNSNNDDGEKIPIPLPPPPSCIATEQQEIKIDKPISNGTTVGVKREVFAKDKKISMDSTAHEKLIHLLDEAEKRVEQMR